MKVYTQLVALAFAVITGAKRAIELQPYAGRHPCFVTDTMLNLVAGACVLRFAVDENEDKGIGEGMSMIICAGIGTSERPAKPHGFCMLRVGQICGTRIRTHSVILVRYKRKSSTAPHDSV